MFQFSVASYVHLSPVVKVRFDVKVTKQIFIFWQYISLNMAGKTGRRKVNSEYAPSLRLAVFPPKISK